MTKRIIGLCDVNNCFVSSEVVFQPELAGKPVVVLSNNEGVAIARSKEAKALGIKMAQPYFQFKRLQQTDGLIIRSANFSLYTNLSERIRSVLETLSPSVVPYSIDESFVDFSLFSSDLESHARIIQQTILKFTGMPVGVGVATSKTLAKAANWAAKKYPKTGGVVDIALNQPKRDKLLSLMPVGDVWGVGAATNKKLLALGISTALQLAQWDPIIAKERFGVNLWRIIQELNGDEILEWQPQYALNQQIIASRSLGEKTDNTEVLFAAIANHVARASKKLRSQKAVAKSITLNLTTSAFSRDGKQISIVETFRLQQPTADNRILLKAAKNLFDTHYQAGFLYAKAGITVQGIESVETQHQDLFSATTNLKSDELMKTLDSLNTRFGKGAVALGSESISNGWHSRSTARSPDYTGDWLQLAVARC